MSIENQGIVLLSVAYHSDKPLRKLADELSLQTKRPKRWIVIDNSPLTSTQIEIHTEFKTDIVVGKEGDGFAKGCNLGLDFLLEIGWEGWVWLLNPDTELQNKNLIKELEQELSPLPANSLVGTAVFDGKGNLEKSAGWIDPGVDFRKRRVSQLMLDEKKKISVDWLSGCSLLIKPSAHQNKPRFETAFPLYYEDMDFCLRLGEKGNPIFWLPSLAISHQAGQGSATSFNRRIKMSTCSYIRFLQRHRSGVVLLLRTMRLLLYALLRLPLNPNRSFAVIYGWAIAFFNPLV